MEKQITINYLQNKIDAILNIPAFPEKMPACILVSGFTGDMNQKGRFEKLAKRLEFNIGASLMHNDPQMCEYYTKIFNLLEEF